MDELSDEQFEALSVLGAAIHRARLALDTALADGALDPGFEHDIRARLDALAEAYDSAAGQSVSDAWSNTPKILR